MAEENNTYITRETLLAKIKSRHDEESWEDFVYYYKGFIYIVCRRLKLSHHDSEEIVQKVLLFLWKALPEFNYNEKLKFRGWLFQVTKNNVRDFYKHVKRHNNKLDKASENSSLKTVSLPDIDDIAETEWKAYIATMALNNIKDNFSDTVIQAFKLLSQGRARTDVAEELGLPPNTVSVYKRRVSALMVKEIRRLNHELGEL